jgi:hypothetical protein
MTEANRYARVCDPNGTAQKQAYGAARGGVMKSNCWQSKQLLKSS